MTWEYWGNAFRCSSLLSGPPWQRHQEWARSKVHRSQRSDIYAELCRWELLWRQVPERQQIDHSWHCSSTDHLEMDINEPENNIQLFISRIWTNMNHNSQKHLNHLPRLLATARNGISSMGVDLRTGPWCPLRGRFQTTLGTPDLFTTFPPQDMILFFSAALSGLWSHVKASPYHSPARSS